jgi:hypothetical protein
MPVNRNLGRKDGVILIAVLWICAVISWIALAVGVEMRLRGNEARIGLEKRKAMYFAVGGFYEAMARMTSEQDNLGAEEEESTFKPDGVSRRISYEDGFADVVIINAQDKVGINTISREDLEEILFDAGLENQASLLADRIIGFREASDLGADGTERALDVDGEDMDFGEFDSIHQLMFVPGLEPWMFYGREIAGNAVTLDEEEGEEFIADRTKPLYEIFSAFGDQDAVEEEADDDDGIPEEVEEDEENLIFENNKYYRILSTGKVSESSAGVMLWVTVRYNSAAKSGYEILERKLF